LNCAIQRNMNSVFGFLSSDSELLVINICRIDERDSKKQITFHERRKT